METAIEAGYSEARFNLVIALLESGRFAEARESLQTLLSEDRSYTDFAALVRPVLDNVNDGSSAFMYYRLPDPFTEEDIARLNSLATQEVEIIWEKALQQALNDGDDQQLASYYQVFSPLLAQTAQERYQDILAKMDSTGTVLDHELMNAFQDETILGAIRSDQYTIDEKYDILIAATQINPNAVGIQKAYCLIAIETGLYEYAFGGLNRLRALLPSNEFDNFSRAFDAALARRQSEDPWVSQPF